MVVVRLTPQEAVEVFVFLISYAALLRTNQVHCEVAICDEAEAERLADKFRPTALGDVRIKPSLG